MDQRDLSAIESTIWDMANKLRGQMDASEYKNYILAFMFYRFLSEKQNRYLVKEELVTPEPGQSPAFAIMDELFGTEDLTKIREYAVQSNSFTKLYREKINKDGQIVRDSDGHTVMVPVEDWVEEYEEFVKDCASYLGYCISPLYSWDALKVLVAEHGVQPKDYQSMFDAFNFSLKYNRDAQKDFEGVFSDVNLGNSRLGSTTVERAKSLSKIIELVDSITYQDDKGTDILGAIYEYLIKQFAASAGKKGGEFYTPHAVSMLMAKIVTYENIKPGQTFTVFDPTCGSGSLLLTVGKEVPDGDKPGAVAYYGQELNTTTYNIARMNLMMNNVDYDYLNLRNADTLGSDWPDGVGPDGKDYPRTTNAVVANPPYSAKWDAPEAYIKDPRFREWGRLAPKSKADMAFLTDGLYHLDHDGVMAVVLPHGILFRGAAEGAIRKALIEKNRIDTVIGLPANLFYGTSIPTIVMVLKKSKKNKDILFIDASRDYEKAKNKNELTEDNIRKIFDAYKDRKDIEKYAHVASLEEIRKNDFNLNIPRYVDSSEEEEEIDLAKVAQELGEVRAEIAKVQEELNKQFKLLGVPIYG